MYIFNQAFTAKSKKTNEPFYQVKLFEKRTNQDGVVYFKDSALFVGEKVFNSIVKQGFNFGDVVEPTVGPSEYLGGPSQLLGLKLVAESPYMQE